MDKIPNKSVNLIVTSPPYNVGIEYENHNDNLDYIDYLHFLNDTWKECHRVLADDGRICINVANTHRKPYMHMSGIIAQQLVKLGFQLRGEIIWLKDIPANANSAWGSFNSPSNPALRDYHEYIVVAHKQDAKLQRKGKSNMLSSDFVKYTLGEWHIKPVNSHKKDGHPVPFPIELPRRCIYLYSYINDIVLDPFTGSGTTCIAAKQLKRQYIGYDNSEKYCEIARKRCQQEHIWKWMIKK